MKKKFTVLVGLLMAVAVTSYSVSGTYAKYTKDFTGTASAKVAKWDVSIKDSTPVDGSYKFNLIDTANYNKGNTVISADNVLAPGTSGKFAITVVNKSDVKAKVESVKLTGTAALATSNILFSVDGGATWSKLSATPTEMTLPNDGSMEMLSTDNSEATVYVDWKWEFEATDAANKDTYNEADNDIAGSNVEIIVDITASQLVKA